MTAETDRLARAADRIHRTLTIISTGTRNHPHIRTLLEHAIEHAQAWADTEPPRHGHRGGTTNPIADDEAAEIRRVHHLAITFLARAPELAKALDRQASELHSFVQRLTSTVDPARLPKREPACASCARTTTEGHSLIGGHFAVVYDRAPTTRLCAWCYRYDLANDTWPPVKACDKYHTEGPRAAGVWLAQQAAA